MAVVPGHNWQVLLYAASDVAWILWLVSQCHTEAVANGCIDGTGQLYTEVYTLLTPMRI